MNEEGSGVSGRDLGGKEGQVGSRKVLRRTF